MVNFNIRTEDSKQKDTRLQISRHRKVRSLLAHSVFLPGDWIPRTCWQNQNKSVSLCQVISRQLCSFFWKTNLWSVVCACVTESVELEETKFLKRLFCYSPVVKNCLLIESSAVIQQNQTKIEDSNRLKLEKSRKKDYCHAL